MGDDTRGDAATSLPVTPFQGNIVSEQGTADAAVPAASTMAEGMPWEGKHVTPIEVTVRSSSEARRLRESAMPVKVIELAAAQRRTADVADILARTEGVAVQRAGGLGAPTRLSLHGLTDDQIRVFYDGVPLEMSGFGFGFASVPLNWIARVDVYRGLLAPEYGADALGGAIDLVSPSLPRAPAASASYALGSFGTHQVAAVGQSYFKRSRAFVRGGAFYDVSRNDYPIRVRVADTETGRLHPATVRRFHDGYRAFGGTVEAGLVRRSWAKRLSLRLFAGDFDKDLQHNAVMDVPYGEITYGQTGYGGSLRYESPRPKVGRLGVKALAAYGGRALDFRDTSRFVYDWYGRRVSERKLAYLGELSGFQTDRTQWEHRAVSRLIFEVPMARGHMARLVLAPDYASRAGRERLRLDPTTPDPLATHRTVLQMVTGVEYGLRLSEGRVENGLFGKYYLFRPASDTVDTQRKAVVRFEDIITRFGVGDALRVRVTEEVLVKAAYEYATRLPRADELFGDGVLILPSLTLRPEVSHNASLGAQLAYALGARGGELSLEVSGFLRDARDLVAHLLAKDRVHTYHANVWGARTLGAEAMVRWESARAFVTLSANSTYQDQRNTSTQGEFASFRGQRIPNRPYLFANGTATVRPSPLWGDRPVLTLHWDAHFVQRFWPGWEDTSATEENKGPIPSQLIFSAGAVCSLGDVHRADLTLDVSNLTDARAYDSLGVQRPGRAVYFKLSLSWEPTDKQADGDET